MHRATFRSAFGLAVLLFLVPRFPTAQTAVLTSSKDNTLYEEASGALSNGLGPVMFCGRVRANGDGAIRRAVLAFDVAGNVPAGATIDSVTLALTVDQVANATARDLDLHALSANWGEGTSSATSGIGAFATTNDATWIHTYYAASFWSNVGGDFAALPSATTAVADTGSYAWSSAQMVADVQAWLDTPATNHGWILIGDESVIQTTKRIATREEPIAAARPQLTIQYTAPCASAAVSFRNAGTNPASYSAGTMVLGGTFSATVDNNVAGQLFSILFAFEMPFSLTLAGGQTLLCIDFGSGELLTGAGASPVSSAAGVDSYALPVPNLPFLCGLAICTQSIEFGVPPFELSNAQDLTIGS